MGKKMPLIQQQRRNAHAQTSPVATIFGATGFLGPYLAEHLATRGIQLVVPYRGEEKDVNAVKPLGEVGQMIPIRFNIRDPASVERAMSHSNIVINLIGREYETRNFGFDEANADSARIIATAAKKLGIERLVHVSCVGASLSSDSKWAQAKAKGEQAVLDIFPEATIIRPTHIFGPEDRFLNRFGLLCYNSKFVPCFVDKKIKVQPVFVDDVAAAIDKVLTTKDSEGQIYEIGGPHAYTMEDMIVGCLDALERGQRGYFTGGVVQVPEKLALIITKLIENSRRPLWLQDQVKFLRRDVVVSPEALTLRDLGIKPTRMENIGHIILQRFKIPSRFLKE